MKTSRILRAKCTNSTIDVIMWHIGLTGNFSCWTNNWIHKKNMKRKLVKVFSLPATIWFVNDRRSNQCRTKKPHDCIHRENAKAWAASLTINLERKEKKKSLTVKGHPFRVKLLLPWFDPKNEHEINCLQQSNTKTQYFTIKSYIKQLIECTIYMHETQGHTWSWN